MTAGFLSKLKKPHCGEGAVPESKRLSVCVPRCPAGLPLAFCAEAAGRARGEEAAPGQAGCWGSGFLSHVLWDSPFLFSTLLSNFHVTLHDAR